MAEAHLPQFAQNLRGYCRLNSNIKLEDWQMNCNQMANSLAANQNMDSIWRMTT